MSIEWPELLVEQCDLVETKLNAKVSAGHKLAFDGEYWTMDADDETAESLQSHGKRKFEIDPTDTLVCNGVTGFEADNSRWHIEVIRDNTKYFLRIHTSELVRAIAA